MNVTNFCFCVINRLFGGLIKDIKRKVPWYASDISDALHIQCVASFFFLFLATLTPNVTFGGLLGKETDQYMVRYIKCLTQEKGLLYDMRAIKALIRLHGLRPASLAFITITPLIRRLILTLIDELN